jgi:hypothetical protein
VRQAEFDADVAAGRQVAAEAERVCDLVVGDLSGPARRDPYGGRSNLAKADHGGAASVRDGWAVDPISVRDQMVRGQELARPAITAGLIDKVELKVPSR